MLLADELHDVCVVKSFQPYLAESGYQVLADVVAIPAHGVRLEDFGLRLEPSDQVVGDGFGVVEQDSGVFALEYVGERFCGVGLEASRCAGAFYADRPLRAGRRRTPRCRVLGWVVSGSGR